MGEEPEGVPAEDQTISAVPVCAVSASTHACRNKCVPMAYQCAARKNETPNARAYLSII